MYSLQKINHIDARISEWELYEILDKHGNQICTVIGFDSAYNLLLHLNGS